MTWTVEYLNSNVERELLTLPRDMQARFLHITGLLEEFGPQHVGMPHVRSLGRKLWEIRMSGQSGTGRAIYMTLHGQRIVILNAFVKKTQKTPQRAIELALQRMKEIES
ncbi:MAG: type II toxin-antitoxin system RelE/ParE family toxin [Gammaproteobacteria bacterium]|nr:type II toxin-antitoxin system RelE/ParE family toxin [Gammaproteobacteria bacterium]